MNAAWLPLHVALSADHETAEKLLVGLAIGGLWFAATAWVDRRRARRGVRAD